MPQSRVDTTDIDLAGRLRTVVGRLSRRLQRTQAGAQLTSTETTVLATATIYGPVGLSRLASQEGMNPTMLSRVVRRLEQAGLVVRHVDPSDQRAALVEATPVGARLHERIRSERTDALNMFVEQLDVAERRALNKALPVLEGLAEALKSRHP